jgi:hypothetical protein
MSGRRKKEEGRRKKGEQRNRNSPNLPISPSNPLPLSSSSNLPLSSSPALLISRLLISPSDPGRQKLRPLWYKALQFFWFVLSLFSLDN